MPPPRTERRRREFRTSCIPPLESRTWVERDHRGAAPLRQSRLEIRRGHYSLRPPDHPRAYRNRERRRARHSPPGPSQALLEVKARRYPNQRQEARPQPSAANLQSRDERAGAATRPDARVVSHRATGRLIFGSDKDRRGSVASVIVDVYQERAPIATGWPPPVTGVHIKQGKRQHKPSSHRASRASRQRRTCQLV
eukprot:scaffold67160_cov28-Tisochrysis_lutea.AAC.10